MPDPPPVPETPAALLALFAKLIIKGGQLFSTEHKFLRYFLYVVHGGIDGTWKLSTSLGPGFGII